MCKELRLAEIKVRVSESTGGQGVSVAFDFVGDDMKRLCFDAVGFDGRIISIVEEPPDFDFNIWRADISPFFAKSGTYHFVALSARARNGGPQDWAVYPAMMSRLASLVEVEEILLPKATDLGQLSEETISRSQKYLFAGSFYFFHSMDKWIDVIAFFIHKPNEDDVAWQKRYITTTVSLHIRYL